MTVTPEMRTGIALERALERGGVDEARRALDDPDEWPNSLDPYLHTHVLRRRSDARRWRRSAGCCAMAPM